MKFNADDHNLTQRWRFEMDRTNFKGYRESLKSRWFKMFFPIQYMFWMNYHTFIQKIG